MTRPKRFRGMELTEDEACELAQQHWSTVSGSYVQLEAYEVFEDRCVSLLPLWRKWAIERDRLWFALIGLGLDIEGDERDMPRAEMRARIEWFIADAEGRREYEERVRATIAHRVMRELDQ